MCVDTRGKLIDFVYRDQDKRCNDTLYLTDRVFLASHISSVLQLNGTIMDLVPSIEYIELYSYDS
eukprot:gene15846-18794_t